MIGFEVPRDGETPDPPASTRRDDRVGVARLLLSAGLCALCACRQAPPPAPEPRDLLVLTGTPLASFDPQVPFDDVTSGLLSNAYEPLVELDKDVRLTPRLALRWLNPDENTWRFELDREARFSDGSPLVAEDVRFSIERLRSLQGSSLTGVARAIRAVEVLDAHTLALRTDRPVAILNELAQLPIVSARAAPPGPARGPEQLLGTGPYRVASWREEGTLTFERNPHSRRRGALPRVDVRLSQDFAADARRLRPDLGVAFNYAAVEALQVAPVPGLSVVPAPGFFVVYLALNARPQLDGVAGRNPLAELAVRRALALAIDRQAVASQGLRGLARPVGQMASPLVFGYDPRLPQPLFQPEEARRQLAAAGFAHLDVQVAQSEGGSGRIEAALLAAWAQAGVQGRVRVLPREQYREELERGALQPYVGGWGCVSGDAAEVLTFLLHSRASEYGAFNVTGWGHPDVDALAERNLREFNPRARRALLQSGLRLAAQEAAFVPLVARDDVYLVADGLRFEPRPDGRLDLAAIAR